MGNSIIKKYLKSFSLYFTIYFLLFGIVAYFGSSKHTELKIVLLGLSIISLGLAIITVFFIFLEAEIWKPYRFKKLLNRPELFEFFQKGFIIENAIDIIGDKFILLRSTISNYYVVISFLKFGVRISEIAIHISFHPKLYNKFLTNEDLNLLIEKYKNEKLIWKFHCVFFMIAVKNSELTTILTRIEEIIRIIKIENLHPISQTEMDNIKPEIDKLIEAKTWDWKFV